MDTNEILFKIQKALNLTNSDILKAYELESYDMSNEELSSILVKRQDKSFKVCSYEQLGVFLDGLITLKRGESPKKPEDEIVELTNNLILKKLRIALELKEPETEIIFSLGELELSKQELKSLFRKESHKNFKVCTDEMLLKFLDGLDEFYFVGEIE
ncbi:hypothetical protein MNB_SV-5-377 [hydrothermal vent metagenome]|uniref:DUF1456 domain-containing protein n=1 Tax=hydrothermal vent metagenome TaxID=652676 RepID=A0A1W1EFA4_9ZZZZ